MNRTTLIVIIVAALVIAGAAYLSFFLKDSGSNVDAAIEVTFTQSGASLSLDRELGLERLVVKENGELPVVDKQFSGVRKPDVNIVMDWNSGSVYEFILYSFEGKFSETATAPVSNEYPLSVEFLVPYTGESANKDSKRFQAEHNYDATVIAGGEFTAAIVVTNYLDTGVEYSVEVEIPEGIGIDPAEEMKATAARDGGRTLRFSGRLRVPYEKDVFTFRLETAHEADYSITAAVRTEAADASLQYNRTVSLRAMGIDVFREFIEPAGDYLPTGIKGLPDRKRQKNTVYVRPDLFKKLGRYLGIAEERFDPWAPYTFQSISLSNKADSPMPLILRSNIYRQNRDETPEAFYPPSEYLGGRRDIAVVVSSEIQPGETARIVLPVFIVSRPPQGTYRRVIEVFPLGSSVPVATYELPMHIISTNVMAFIFTMGAVILSIGGFIFLLLRFNALIKNMKVRWLVIIALYGAMTFAVLNVPIRIFGAMLSAFSGPFSVFITGFFSEILYYTLLVSLVRLIPRPGIVTLTVLVRYLLNGMLFGGFQFADILFTGSSIVAKEAAFYVSGVTRKGDDFKWTLSSTLFVAFCLSVADAYINLTNTYLFMALYRLYYAQWYIWMNVAVNGFLYTWIATFTGKRFSDKLKWSDV